MKPRTFLALALLVSVASAAFAQEEQSPLELNFLREVRIPTGLEFNGTEFGGISGIDFDAANNVYHVISDDRSQHAPSRFYTLSIGVTERGFGRVTIESVTVIQQPAGPVFREGSVDGESIRLSPEGTLIWASERDAANVPHIREMDMRGVHIRELPLPTYYLPAEGMGVHPNQGFEAMTLSLDGEQLIVGTESALRQDGGVASLEAGSLSRLLFLDLETGEATAEFIYETGPIVHEAIEMPYFQDNGLVEILPLGDNTFLTMERAFARGKGNTINFYLIDTTEATNVLGVETVQGMDFEPVSKTPVLTLNEGDFGLDVDNVEGATFGPELNGERTLILVSDNNFSEDQPFTHFLFFTLAER